MAIVSCLFVYQKINFRVEQHLHLADVRGVTERRARPHCASTKWLFCIVEVAETSCGATAKDPLTGSLGAPATLKSTYRFTVSVLPDQHQQC